MALNGWCLDRASISQAGRSLSCFWGAQPHGCGTTCIQSIFPLHSRQSANGIFLPPKQCAIAIKIKPLSVLKPVNLLFSHIPFFATLWTAACQASLSFTISQSLPKFMSTDLMMLSNHPFLCHSSSPALNLSQHKGLFQ